MNCRGFTPLETIEQPQEIKRSLSGFTLIETIMVIVIIGILAAVAVPRFNAFYAIKLDGAMKKARSDIRYLQQLAISQHVDTRIVFNTGSNSYQAQNCNGSGSNCTAWSPAIDPFTRGNLLTNFNSDPQYGGIDISAASFQGETLRFDWQGIPYNNSGLPLISDGLLTLVYQGNSKSIYVTANTGRVRIE